MSTHSFSSGPMRCGLWYVHGLLFVGRVCVRALSIRPMKASPVEGTQACGVRARACSISLRLAGGVRHAQSIVLCCVFFA